MHELRDKYGRFIKEGDRVLYEGQSHYDTGRVVQITEYNEVCIKFRYSTVYVNPHEIEVLREGLNNA